MLNATLNCFSPESDTSSELATIQGVAGAVSPNGRLLAYVSWQGALGYGGRYGPNHLRLLDLETRRSEEHTSELQSLMRISYAVFCLKKKKHTTLKHQQHTQTCEHYQHIHQQSNS